MLHLASRIFLILVSAQVFFASCKSKSKLLIDRNLPKSEVSTVKANDVLISSSRVVRDANRDRVTFVYWRFLNADQKKIYLQYEEYYETIKAKPDLVDKKEFEAGNQLEIDEYQITIYKLDTKLITYQVSQKSTGARQ